MKKLLIISETWYPDSRATISIMARMAEVIAQKGIEVFAAPLKPLADGKDYPAEHNGIYILAPDAEYRETLELKWNKLLLSGIRKLLLGEKRLLIKDSNSKWTRWIQHLRAWQRKHWYNPVSDRIRNISSAQHITAVIDKYKIDSVISVSLPFWIHSATALAQKNCVTSEVSWVPISFDPYAYDESISQEEQKRRICEEHSTFQSARKILMLSQSAQDYQADSLLHKMNFFQIPNIRELTTENLPQQVQLDNDHINCVFIGNLYWTVRNPESLFQLFEKFSDPRICLHIIGALSYDFPDGYMAQWEKKLGNRFVYHKRVTSEEAAAVMNVANVLINIGNTTSNQCPSKVLEYISTGKPVLSISKIERCTSEVYLKRYPLAHLIRETDCSNQEIIRQAEAFLLTNYTRRMEFHDVVPLFSDCTTEKAVDHILTTFR